MRILKLTLAYEGTGLVGWQRQRAGVSIQGLVEEAAARIVGSPAVRVTGAGRTDAGVHALGQVASLTVDTALAPAEIRRALNAVLPAAVRILAVEEARPGFHARFDAVGKRYAYRLISGPVLSPFEVRTAWHVRHRLEPDAMRAALGALVGTHDFAAFQATGSTVSDTVRTITEARLDEVDTFAGGRALTMTVAGDGFLRHMVRTLVGTLVEIGRGRRSAETMAALIASRDRTQAGPTAPPHGLTLVEVTYRSGQEE